MSNRNNSEKMAEEKSLRKLSRKAYRRILKIQDTLKQEKYDETVQTIKDRLNEATINTIFDVGANVGKKIT